MVPAIINCANTPHHVINYSREAPSSFDVKQKTCYFSLILPLFLSCFSLVILRGFRNKYQNLVITKLLVHVKRYYRCFVGLFMPVCEVRANEWLKYFIAARCPKNTVICVYEGSDFFR